MSVSSFVVDELFQVADVKARQWLRSTSSSSLIVSCTPLSTVGDPAFPLTAAQHVSSSPSVTVFQTHLDTHLFSISYHTS